MKKIFCYILLAIFLAPVSGHTEPPGGGYNGWRFFFASFSVFNPAANPVSGVNVKLFVHIYGTEGDGYAILYGITNSEGWVNLSTTLYYQGYEEGHYMLAYINDDRYTVLSSSNTYTTTSYNLYPDFEVILDLDQNGINDNWELPLAEKFCPSLKLHSQDHGVSPEPVEIMGDFYGVWARVWTLGGTCIGDWRVVDDPGFDPSLADIFYNGIYYWCLGHWEGDNPTVYRYIGTPPGGGYGVYLTLFHFDWAGPEEFGQGGQDDPAGWVNVYLNGNSIGPGYGPGAN